MPLIIAATDFSNVAQNAVKYACGLAASQNAQVLILHSYVMPVMFSDVPVPSTLVTDALSDAETQMKDTVNDMRAAYPDLNIKGRVIYGDTIDILDEVERQTQPMLIAVGNSAGDKNTWLDNTLQEEFKKLKYPVLAVPQNTAYKPVQKICLAFDNKHTGNGIALQQLTFLAQALNAELHVVNTQPDVHNQDNNVGIDNAAMSALSSVNPHYHIIYDVQDIDGALKDYVDKNNMDWLIMIPRKHSFFEGLFHKSHTKAVSEHAAIPVMALHEHI